MILNWLAQIRASLSEKTVQVHASEAFSTHIRLPSSQEAAGQGDAPQVSSPCQAADNSLSLMSHKQRSLSPDQLEMSDEVFHLIR